MIVKCEPQQLGDGIGLIAAHEGDSLSDGGCSAQHLDRR